MALPSQSGGFQRVLPAAISWWLFGAFAALALLYGVVRTALVFPLVIAVLVVLVIRSPERAAMGGGGLVSSGLWFLYELRAAVERCAEMDRSPSGSCEIYGVEEQGFAMVLYLMVGLGLTAYAALRPRLTRA